MVSKSGFMNVRRQNLPRAAKMFKQNSPMNIPNGFNPMFNASQIPDNPGYMDFNNPTPPPIPPINTVANNKKITRAVVSGGGGGRPQRNMMPPPRNIAEPHRNNWGGRNARGGPIRPNHPKFGGGAGNRQFNGMNMPRRPMPPIPPIPMRGPMPPIPPIDPMCNHLGPMPPMMRNGMVGVRPGPPMPPIPPPMMRRPRNGMLPPAMRRGNNPNAGKIIIKHKRNGNKPNKAASTLAQIDVPSKKTLKEIINQYPLDKPWVTEEIRQEHAKKEEIENKLKGKKNDELFAAFKIQRDKFVALYETARNKHLEETKSKDNEPEPDKTNR